MRAAVIVVLGLVTVATAAPKQDPVTAAMNAMAEADFDKALALLDAALVKNNSPQVIERLQLMRGEALVALTRIDEATRAFGAALAANPLAALDPSTASPDAVSAMAAARRQILSDLSIAIAGGAQADVKLDDIELGPAPLKTRAGAGKHRIEAITRAGVRVTQEIELVPTKPLHVVMELPAPVAPTPAPVAVAPAPVPTVKKVAPTSSGRPKAALIPIGLGVVGLGVGVGLAVDSAGKYTALKQSLDNRVPPADFTAQVAAGRTEQTIGLVVGSVGLAMAVGGGLWFLLGGSSSQSVSVYANGSGAGVAAMWELP
jgi:hypothetical protein